MSMVRSITENDLGALSEIVRRCVRESVVSSEKDAQFLVEDIEASLSGWFEKGMNGFGRIYEDEGRVVGFIVVKDYWNLSHLFVLPDFYRRGIGAALIRGAMEGCATKSPKGKLRLNSSSHAAPFYHAMGFEQTGPGIDRQGGCIPFEYAF